jgi:hypothetical protein
MQAGAPLTRQDVQPYPHRGVLARCCAHLERPGSAFQSESFTPSVPCWVVRAQLLTTKAGLDDIISLVPIYGDIVSGILQLYQVWLSVVFGVPPTILWQMVRPCPAYYIVVLLNLSGLECHP